MAQTFKRKASIKGSGDRRVAAPEAELTISNTGDKFLVSEQTIGTSAEALNKGDITNIRAIMVRNLDPTNYVELSLDSGTTYISKIPAGNECGPILLPDSQANVHLRANTASVEVLYTLVSSS